MICREPSRFIVTVDGVFVVGCKIVGVGLVDCGVVVFKLDCSLGLLLFGAGWYEKWTSGGMVSMVDETGGF